MKESLAKLDKRLVFRETFTDENSVRANGGVPSNVVFEKGVGKFNGSTSYIQESIPLKGIYSIRIKFKSFVLVTLSYIFDCRLNSGIGYSYINNTTVAIPSGTAYVDGITNTVFNTNSKELVISGITLLSTSLVFFRKATTQEYYTNANAELFEIYEGTLTAQEVKNLYENKRYKQLMPHGEILGPNICINGNFIENINNWTKVRCDLLWNINGYCEATQNTGASADCIITQSSILTIGKRYVINFDIKSDTSTSPPKLGTAHFSSIILDTKPLTSEWQSYSFSGTSVGSVLGIYLSTGAIPDGTKIDIDNISVKEVISSITPILDVDAFDGVIKNRLSGGLLPNIVVNGEFNTDTSWTKIGGSWSISNGVASNNGTHVSTSYLQLTSNVLIIGKTYRVKFYVVGKIGSPTVAVGAGNGGNIIVNGLNDITTVCIGNIEFFFIFPVGASVTSIDNISIQEIIPSVIPTAVQVVKDGGVNVMRFNGSTSKIDCGSYNGLTGDITICGWVKVGGLPSADNYILNNGKLMVDLVRTNNHIQVTSNGWSGLNYVGPSNTIKNATPQHIIVTRTSSNSVGVYINGVLSGTLQQGANPNLTGTTNIFLGMFLLGNIAQLQIFSGIMSAQEISQLYTSQRSKYNI